MGTRADFYVGKGAEAEWLGSIAFDGYPDGVSTGIFVTINEEAYRREVEKFLSASAHATEPEMGWPWPWEDSSTTDYAYAFFDGSVHASGFGSPWFDPKREQPESDDGPRPTFPDMCARKNVTFGRIAF